MKINAVSSVDTWLAGCSTHKIEGCPDSQTASSQRSQPASQGVYSEMLGFPRSSPLFSAKIWEFQENLGIPGKCGGGILSYIVKHL